MTKRSHAAIVAALVLATNGCLSYANDRLPKRSYGEIVARQRVAIDYDLSVQWQGTENANARPHSSEVLEKVVNQAACFSSFREGRGSPWHMSITVNNTGGDNGTAILCGLTLMVFPAFATDEWTFTANLFHNNQLVKTYTYNDSMTTIIEILLIFVSPFFNPVVVGQECGENIVRNFLHDLMQDNILTDDGPRLAPPPTSRPPEPSTTTPAAEETLPAPNAPPPNASPNAPPPSKDDR